MGTDIFIAQRLVEIQVRQARCEAKLSRILRGQRS